MNRPIEPTPHYHQIRGQHLFRVIWDELRHHEVDEPPPDDGFDEIDNYDPELNMNQDAPISYYEGPDTWEEAEGLR